MTERIKTKIKEVGRARFITASAALIAILLTLVFIISNSAKSMDASSEQSGAFKEFIEGFIPEDTRLGAWILDNIRKIAHFTEYGLLGAETAVLLCAAAKTQKKRLISGALSMFFGLLVAFFDETVQIFAKRGPAIADMWIDLFGFFSFSLFAYIGAELFFAIIKPRAERRATEEMKS